MPISLIIFGAQRRMKGCRLRRPACLLANPKHNGRTKKQDDHSYAKQVTLDGIEVIKYVAPSEFENISSEINIQAHHYDEPHETNNNTILMLAGLIQGNANQQIAKIITTPEKKLTSLARLFPNFACKILTRIFPFITSPSAISSPTSKAFTSIRRSTSAG